MLLVTSPVMSESHRIGQKEKLSCDAVAKEASVDPMVRFGALVLFALATTESRAFVLQHNVSLDTDASRKGVVFSFSLGQFLERTHSDANY